MSKVEIKKTSDAIITLFSNLNTVKTDDKCNVIAVSSFTGYGEVGLRTISYLLDALIPPPERILEILPLNIDPCVIFTKGLGELPKITLYFWKQNRKGLFLVHGPVVPLSPKTIFHIVDYISSFLVKFHVKELISLGCYKVNVFRKNPKIYVGGSERTIVEKIVNFGAKTLDNIEFLGINAVFPMFISKFYKIPSALLLVDGLKIVVDRDGTDFRACLAMLRFLQKYLNLQLVLDKLEKTVKEQYKFLLETKKVEEIRRREKTTESTYIT